MKRAVFIIILSLALTMMACGLCFASELTWQEDMGVNYDGKTIESSVDMEKALGNLKAGDVLTFNIALENSADDEMIWWLDDSVLDSIRESTLSSGGAMTYELEYDGTLLYSNMEGTDNEYVMPEDDSMPGYIYLGNFEGTSSGNLIVKVSLQEGFTGKASDYAAHMNLSFSLESSVVKSAPSAAPAEAPVNSIPVQAVLPAAIVVVMAGLLFLETKGSKGKSLE